MVREGPGMVRGGKIIEMSKVLLRFCNHGFMLNLEMNFRAWRLGATIKEEPIIFVDRTIGESKMSSTIMYEAIWMVWRLRIWKLFGWI